VYGDVGSNAHLRDEIEIFLVTVEVLVVISQEERNRKKS
jgi:hypothetical protein